LFAISRVMISQRSQQPEISDEILSHDEIVIHTTSPEIIVIISKEDLVENKLRK
jgi:hypothetical protein